MRPINLIPAEERRGAHAPLRSGPVAYILLGALVAVLVGVTALVLTGNQISESKADIARLEAEDAKEEARAQRLASYVQFRDLREQRTATVSSLADSRFDWERVMRELALVLPRNTWLIELTATASPDVSVEGAEGGTKLRPSAPGPALALTGCAVGQKAVAGFVTSLKDIDGVTRVGVESSELPGLDAGEEGDDGSGESGDSESDVECRTRRYIAKFEIVVAFDAAPVPPSAGGGEAAPVEAETSEASETSEEDEEGEG